METILMWLPFIFIVADLAIMIFIMKKYEPEQRKKIATIWFGIKVVLAFFAGEGVVGNIIMLALVALLPSGFVTVGFVFAIIGDIVSALVYAGAMTAFNLIR